MKYAVDWRRFAVGMAVIVAVVVALAVWLDWSFLVVGALLVIQLSVGAWQIHRRRR